MERERERESFSHNKPFHLARYLHFYVIMTLYEDSEIFNISSDNILDETRLIDRLL